MDCGLWGTAGLFIAGRIAGDHLMGGKAEIGRMNRCAIFIYDIHSDLNIYIY